MCDVILSLPYYTKIQHIINKRFSANIFRSRGRGVRVLTIVFVKFWMPFLMQVADECHITELIIINKYNIQHACSGNK